MIFKIFVITAATVSLLVSATPQAPKPETGARHEEGGNLDDKELARKVRKAIADDHMLSPQAKTITVMAKGGKVTLSGFVADEAEKDKIESKAESVAGTGNVTSKLEVRKA